MTMNMIMYFKNLINGCVIIFYFFFFVIEKMSTYKDDIVERC